MNPWLVKGDTVNIHFRSAKQAHQVKGNINPGSCNQGVFIEVFNNFNGSAELLGFYGSNSVQGAAGVGYSLADGIFVDAKAMFPYSEIGVRLMNQAEIYGGAKTLGSFNPAQDRRLFLVP